jgi:hypothetical protein
VKPLVNRRMVRWMRRNRRSEEVTGSFWGVSAGVPLGGEAWQQWYHLSFRILPFLIEKSEHMEHHAAFNNSGHDKAVHQQEKGAVTFKPFARTALTAESISARSVSVKLKLTSCSARTARWALGL